MFIRAVALLILLVGSVWPAAAQQVDGSRIRLRPRGPESPWLDGRLQPLGNDSVAIRLAGGSQTLHLVPDRARLEYFAGRNYAKGMLVGAVIGGVTLALIPPIADSDIRYQSMDALLLPVLFASGAVLGGAVGAAFAPARWSAQGGSTARCSEWVLAPGSEAATRDGSIRLDGARNRRRGAAIGAIVLGSVALVGIATDSESISFDNFFAVPGNALLGAGLGAWLAPRRAVWVPRECPNAR